MPIVRVESNVLKDVIKPGFAARFAQLISTTLNKPMEKITTIVDTGKDMVRHDGGPSAQPVFLVHISALFVFDNLSQENRDKYVTAYQDFFKEEFSGVPDNRVMLVFEPLNPGLLSVAVKPAGK